MTTHQTAELRRWWRDPNKRKNTIWGHVYNDPNDFWDDGELGEFEVVSLVNTVNFYILHTSGMTIFKLDKGDELQKK